MLQVLADENIDKAVVLGLLRRNPQIHILTVQELGFSGQDDQYLLEWATQHDLILITHDIKTIPRFVSMRLKAGIETAGVIAVRFSTPIGIVIEELLLLIECCDNEELANKVIFISIQ